MPKIDFTDEEFECLKRAIVERWVHISRKMILSSGKQDTKYTDSEIKEAGAIMNLVMKLDNLHPEMFKENENS